MRRHEERDDRFKFRIREYRVNCETLKVLTATQYYDSENITESKLSFRRAIYDPRTHGRNDDFCPKVLYDMDR